MTMQEFEEIYKQEQEKQVLMMQEIEQLEKKSADMDKEIALLQEMIACFSSLESPEEKPRKYLKSAPQIVYN